MKNVLLSLVMVAVLVSAGVGGTLAQWQEDDHGTYDWDAGYLNLRVDIEGDFIDSDDLGDLINEDQLMPGDSGETTLSFHVDGLPDAAPNAGPAYATLTVIGTFTSVENDRIEPEDTAGDTTDGVGELEDYLVIKLWCDDGDNVYQHDEYLIFWGTLADLVSGIGGPIEIDLEICETYYLGVGWELADYGEWYNHGTVQPSPDDEVNQCMTDEISGVVVFTVVGPWW